MATYLATVDIGNWIIKTGTTPGGIPETVAVDPTIVQNGNPGAVDFFYDTTAEATDLWVEKFGPYPFDSTGAIADNATYNGHPLGFSLETQTRPVYSAVRSTSTIAHELAHQWFGDAVTLSRLAAHLAERGVHKFPGDVPLARSTGARASAHDQFVAELDSIKQNSPFWDIVDRRSAARHDVRPRGLPARGDDAPGAAATRSATTEFLPGPEDVDRGAPARARRPPRSSSRSASGSPGRTWTTSSRRLALHAREADELVAGSGHGAPAPRPRPCTCMQVFQGWTGSTAPCCVSTRPRLRACRPTPPCARRSSVPSSSPAVSSPRTSSPPGSA